MASSSQSGFWRFVERFGPTVALVVLVGVGVAFFPNFRTPENFQNILWNAAPAGIAAVGMTFVIILGGIDLSVGSTAALVGVGAIVAMNALSGTDGPSAGAVLLAVLVCLAGGMLLGVLNGGLITAGRVAPFVATLATMAGFKSVAQYLSNDGTVSARGELFNKIGSGGIPLVMEGERVALKVPFPVVAFVGAGIVGHWLLMRTTFGMNVRAIGDNEQAARYAGVHVGRVRLATYSLCGLTAGLGSLMTSSYMNSAAPFDTGRMWELDAIAAVVIGGTRMSGGVGTVYGTLVGAVLLNVIDVELVFFDAPTQLQGLFKGCIILAAVLVQRGRKS